MFRNKYTVKIICILLTFGLLAGCGYYAPPSDDGIQKSEGGEEAATLGLTPEFNYEVPKSLPNILVDQVGYALRCDKVAIFKGELPPDNFSIIDVRSGREVYKGKIEPKGYDKTTGDFVSYGEFSEFDTEGEYYIEAALIGQSYSFRIAKNPYRDLFAAVLKEYYFNRCGVTLSTEHAGEMAHNACHTKEAQMKSEAGIKLDVSGGWHVDGNGSRSVADGCRTINYLLLSYELYPSVFTDDIDIPESGNGVPDVLDEVRQEIVWLLKMQDAKSGAVYAAVNSVDSKPAGYMLYVDGVTMEATVQFAAAMAKFSYLYQSYDKEFATVCLKASDRAFRYVQNYLNDISPEQYFYAATELYRATGAYGYHTVIKDYLAENPISDMENDFVFLGCVTYLSTVQMVDVNLCEDMIRVLMKSAELISYASKDSKFLVNVNKEQTNNDKVLKDIARLAVVDHIITNHEYATVLENHLHYFLGRNLLSISYLDNAGTRSYKEIDEAIGVMKHIDLNAEMVLLMSAILIEEIYEE